RATVQGLRCFPTVNGLPEAPELAIVAVAGDAALAAVADCARSGVKVAIVMSSGFGETNDEGRRAEKEMVDCARAGGMRIIGPNSQGLANFGNGTVASFSTMFTETPPLDGPVGI